MYSVHPIQDSCQNWSMCTSQSHLSRELKLDPTHIDNSRGCAHAAYHMVHAPKGYVILNSDVEYLSQSCNSVAAAKGVHNPASLWESMVHEYLISSFDWAVSNCSPWDHAVTPG